MRVIVFFDLPVQTANDRREYTVFRRHLIKSGFIMMQESVYSKLALNASAVASITEAVRKNKPPKGLLQILVVTEKQYARMEYVLGEAHTDIIDTDERTVFL